jgi:hypothetical protein
MKDVAKRFAKGAVPVAIVLGLLLALGENDSDSVFRTVCVFLICLLILWFGWSWIRLNLVTKSLGIIVGAFLTFVVATVAIGITLRIGLVLLVVFLLALPLLIYDLFFRSPYKGRFARARAERHHLRP